ncbi:MAG: hypothetical protein ACW98Y_16745 [Candidatus Thorarchaeota archaeon]|jgi:hypothetical protein
MLSLYKGAYHTDIMLESIDLALIVCMYDENRIGRHHGNIERILDFCTPKEYRDRYPMGRLRKRLRQLSTTGYLHRKQGRFEAFSLSPRGVIVAERSKEGWTLEEINEAELQEGFL